MKYLQNHIRILNFLKCFPYEFDPQTERIVVTGNTFKRKFSIIIHSLEFVYLFFSFNVLYKVWSNACIGMAAEGGMIVIVILLMMLWSVDVKPNLQAISVVNSSLKFEEKFGGEWNKILNLWEFMYQNWWNYCHSFLSLIKIKCENLRKCQKYLVFLKQETHFKYPYYSALLYPENSTQSIFMW